MILINIYLIQISKAVDFLLLNSADLEIREASLVQNGNTMKATSTELLPKDETLKLSFGKTLETGNAILKISFDGLLEDNLKGFYRSKYQM